MSATASDSVLSKEKKDMPGGVLETTSFPTIGDAISLGDGKEARLQDSGVDVDVDDENAFEVRWDGDDDPANPRSRSTLRKWTVVLILSTSSLCVTCTSSIYAPMYGQIEHQFQVSNTVAILGLSMYVGGLAFGPLFLAPLSEFYGRRPIYIVSFFAFLAFLVPSAVARNIETLLISRFLDGVAGSSFLSVAGGSVGDLFDKAALHTPMMVFTASPLVGPSLGPLVGGFISQYTTWRWTFYAMIIWAGALWVLIITLVPETYHPVLLRQKAIKLRQSTGNEKWHAPIEKTQKSIAKTILWSFLRPVQMLFMELMCFNLCLYQAFISGVLYLFFGEFAIVFKANYNFQQYQVGLSFLGIFFGMVGGFALDPFWRWNYERLVKNHQAAGNPKGSTEPEFRLPPAILGGIIVPISLFWFGWTTYPAVHWIVPIIASGFFGMGLLLVFNGVFTFLVQCYPLYGASGLGAAVFSRCIFAAVFPLFGGSMYHKLGVHWATTLLAFISLGMTPLPYLFFRYGKRLRKQSIFASDR